MDPHLNEELTDAVRRWARPTTADELKKRGVRLRSLSLTRVASLIEKAVNRTMIARTLDEEGPGPEDATAFSAHARTEFLAMLRGDEDVERASERAVEAEARGALGKLKDELASRRRAVSASSTVFPIPGPPWMRAFDVRWVSELTSRW